MIDDKINNVYLQMPSDEPSFQQLVEELGNQEVGLGYHVLLNIHRLSESLAEDRLMNISGIRTPLQQLTRYKGDQKVQDGLVILRQVIQAYRETGKPDNFGLLVTEESLPQPIQEQYNLKELDYLVE